MPEEEKHLHHYAIEALITLANDHLIIAEELINSLEELGCPRSDNRIKRLLSIRAAMAPKHR